MEENNKKNKLEHPCFPQPIDMNTKVWRYMETSKFIDLISRNALFLCRLDLLGDTHEGSITKVSYESRKLFFQERGLPDLSNNMSENKKKTKKDIFVNCWYYDNHESEAMWRLYCPDDKGVAIQTTYKKLVDSIDNNDDMLFIGQIKYIDYEKEWFPDGNIFYPVMHKRKAFEHEREIRIVKSDSKYWSSTIEETPNGIYCQWDVMNTVENLYVNPYSKEWYYEVIKDILNKYGCDIKINWSTMKDITYY